MHTRYTKLIRILACWAGLVAIIGCGTMMEEESSSAPAVVAPAAEVAPTAEPAPAAGGGTCSRVAACCRAYVNVMGATVPASTCDAYDNVVGMPEAACSSAINGYRSGLNAMQKAVPPECN